MNSTAQLLFLVRHSVSGHVYESEIAATADEFGLTPDAWVFGALAVVARESKMSRAHRSVLDAALGGCREAKLNTLWLDSANKSSASVTLEVVISAFRGFEIAIGTSKNYGTDKRSRASSEIRRWLIRYATDLNVPLISRINSQFRSDLPPPKTRGRALISDMPHRSRPPIGAIPHTNVEELKKSTSATIQGTLNSIEVACLAELAEFESTVSRFRAEMKEVGAVDDRKARILSNVLEGVYSRGEWYQSISLRALAGWYYEIRIRASRGNKDSVHMPRAVAVYDYLSARFGWRTRFGNLTDLFFIPDVGTTGILASCLLLLTKISGWNSTSVLLLRRSNVTKDGESYSIQSRKPKTKDHTPIVLIGKADVGAWLAIEFLLKRLSFMKELGWATDGDLLWLNAQVARRGDAKPYIGWNKLLKNFCKKYDLPPFAPEQLRVEVLAARSLANGLSAAQHTAGHAQLFTTSDYVYKELIQRRNSSISLEFQSQLQASVKYNFSDSTRNPELRANLLYPIGDGSSCSNPNKPPDDRFIEFGVCNRQGCHLDGGCKNRKIELDGSRFEEIARLWLYYREHWRDLHERNVDRFRKLDLPALVFNEVLRALVMQGSYRHVYIAIEKAIEGEML